MDTYYFSLFKLLVPNKILIYREKSTRKSTRVDFEYLYSTPSRFLGNTYTPLGVDFWADTYTLLRVDFRYSVTTLPIIR